MSRGLFQLSYGPTLYRERQFPDTGLKYCEFSRIGTLSAPAIINFQHRFHVRQNGATFCSDLGVEACAGPWLRSAVPFHE